MKNKKKQGVHSCCRRGLGTVVLVFIMIIAMCLLSACGKIGDSIFHDEDKLNVVATIFAGYDFAKQIGGEKAEVYLLLKPGSEAHSFEPTPADIIAIEKSDVFICTGGENDAWVETILESIDNPNLVIIRMTECVGELLEEEETEGMQGEGGIPGSEEEDEEEVEWDEHVWMDADNAVRICEEIARTFADIDPEDREYYLANSEAYSGELLQIDGEIRTTVENAPGKEIIFADRFPARYFTERYGLEYYAAFPGCSENAEASAATVSFLIDKVREDEIPAVFKIELSSGKLATVVSEETGAEVLVFYTGHNVTADNFEAGMTFADMLRSNLTVLKKVLY